MLQFSIREDLDASTTRNHAEITSIKGQHPPPTALSTRHHRGIGESERQVCITRDQCANPGYVFLSAVERVRAGFEILQEQIERAKPEALFDHVRNLGEDSGWNEVRADVSLEYDKRASVIRITPVEER
jgi:hypothetical protein